MALNRQVLFISHGGGPLPLLGDPGHKGLVDQLQMMRERLKRPKAIIVISAHWEEDIATVTSGAAPSLIYDYNGFPPESYEIQYPSVGAPELAAQVHETLEKAGVSSQLTATRGYDHGMFVPLKILYPDADIPVIQVSLLNQLDAQAHLELGQALSALSADDLLIIGSGFSFHNMRAFFQKSAEADEHNAAFEAWLKETMRNPELSETERWQRLVEWEQAPSARFCHPREEHLLPLMVCYGLTQRACDFYDTAEVLGKHAGLFYWHD